MTYYSISIIKCHHSYLSLLGSFTLFLFVINELKIVSFVNFVYYFIDPKYLIEYLIKKLTIKTAMTDKSIIFRFHYPIQRSDKHQETPNFHLT